MTRLLVSVRDAAEARIALETGADLIDVKEPRRGSLGAADPAVIAAVVEMVAGRAPISVALGELTETTLPTLLPRGVEFAKVGLAGCGKIVDWLEQWKQFIEAIPVSTASVAVVYADTCHAISPSVDEIVPNAARFGCAAVLVDTWDKNAGPLVLHWSLDQIRSFVLDVQRRGMMAVVGGGLVGELVEEITAIRPDYIAVRGAVCDGERGGSLVGEQVQRLKKLVEREGVGNHLCK